MDAPVCTACGGDEWIELHRSENNLKLQCDACDAIQTIPNVKARTIPLRLVISDGAESMQEFIDVEIDEEVRVGDEFELHDRRLLVTGIEEQDNRRVQKARADQVTTLFSKRFDSVTVKFAINEGDKTRSASKEMLPEEPVEVGAKMTVQDLRVVVKTIKTDENKTVRRGEVMARHIRRVFCDPARARRFRDKGRRNPQRR